MRQGRALARRGQESDAARCMRLAFTSRLPPRRGGPSPWAAEVPQPDGKQVVAASSRSTPLPHQHPRHQRITVI
jgi:hypothetical protein